MRQRSVVFFGWATLALAGLSQAQTAAERYLIKPAQITAALRSRSIATDGLEVRIPAQITATVPDAPLEIQAVTPTGAHAARLRVQCSQRRDCLPFFAEANWPADAGLPVLPVDLQPRKVTAPVFAKGNSATLPAGRPATLEMEQGRIHIRLEVMSLEPGEVGERIHVSSRDHKQVYTAEVVSSTLLKGSLSK